MAGINKDNTERDIAEAQFQFRNIPERPSLKRGREKDEPMDLDR